MASFRFIFATNRVRAVVENQRDYSIMSNKLKNPIKKM